MTGIPGRVTPPVAPPATAATPLARRASDDARPPDGSPEQAAAPRPGSPGARYPGGVPDPSGRSGSLVDVFA